MSGSRRSMPRVKDTTAEHRPDGVDATTSSETGRKPYERSTAATDAQAAAARPADDEHVQAARAHSRQISPLNDRDWAGAVGRVTHEVIASLAPRAAKMSRHELVSHVTNP